jgi:hypothetical protein
VGEELEVRQLNDPQPLPVSWRPADADLVPEWSALVSTARRWPYAEQAEWAAEPAGLAGSDHDLRRVLASIPTGRLVVSGGPGAGKTMLLVRLVLDLLNPVVRSPGDPVAVLIPLASWNPARQGFRSWLLHRLTVDYPALAAPASVAAGASTQAQALLDEHLLLPILDGLDELPATVRSCALDRLNAELRPGERIVVSARSEEYREVAHPPAGVPVTLHGAAAVVLEDITSTAAEHYLCPAAAGPGIGIRWAQVSAALGTATPVGRALRTPLMISLAAVIYTPRPSENPRTAPDPSELCDTGRFPTQAAVEEHLLNAFIHASYRPHPGAARRRRWTASQAQRYLSFLARHLERDLHGTTDLAWWALCGPGFTPAKSLRWSPVACQGKLAFISAAALVVGLPFMLAGKPGVGLVAVVGCALAFALAAGMQTASADLTVAVAPAMVLARDRRMFLSFGLIIGPLAGMAVGVIMQPTGSGPLGGLTAGPQIGLVSGLIIGPIAWLVFTLLFSPATGALFGVIIGVADWLLCWLLAEVPVVGLTGKLITGLVIGVVTGLLFGARHTAWATFVIKRCWFAARRHLPWRLMMFLADAHERGVLRQAGTIYQFRHIQLQQYLARNPGRGADQRTYPCT